MAESGGKDPNPWLSIPASDYEGHMASPTVRQLEFVSVTFGALLDEFRPESVAVLGVATGNGLEHIDSARVKRIVGIDINPEYLELARRRFGRRLPGLELLCADIASCEIEADSFDFVYAALVFEYLDPAVIVEKVARWLRPGGVAAALLQLPAGRSGKVSDTPYRSLAALEKVMRLVEPERLGGIFLEHGFAAIRSETHTLPGGKPFFVGVYRRDGSAPMPRNPAR